MYYSSEVLDLQRRMEVLGNQGAYKEAKKIKKALKDVQKVEKSKSVFQSKEKLLSKSKMLIDQHEKELSNLLKKHSAQRKGLVI